MTALQIGIDPGLHGAIAVLDEAHYGFNLMRRLPMMREVSNAQFAPRRA